MTLSTGNSPVKTLFLDRDGVINRRIPGGYVKSIDDLDLFPGVTADIARLNRFFHRIIIVSNQQGVGKGIMTKKDVDTVHGFLRKALESSGAVVDGIYFCPSLASDNDPCRKPSPGMAFQAQHDFPDIDFSHAVMAGDSRSDLIFARNLNMDAVYIESEPDRDQDCEGLYQLKFPSLKKYALWLEHNEKDLLA